MNRFTAFVQITACALMLASCATPPEKGQSGGDGAAESVTGSGIELIEFYADWNRACKMQEVVTKGLAEEYAGRANVTRIDAEANPDALKGYGVESEPPVLILLVDGKVATKLDGLRSAEELRKLIDKALGKK